VGLEALGVSIPDHDLRNSKRGKTLIIAAGGRCVWDDLRGCGYPSEPGHDVMCVNDMIAYFPGKVTHAYSNDAPMLGNWVRARRPLLARAHGGPRHTFTCGVKGHHSSTVFLPWPGHGTSGLNAVYTGLWLGYDRIILCGVPLDNSGHFFEPDWVTSNFQNEVADTDRGPRYWEQAARKVFDGRVKSMSGRTRELLGAP
jgi:hypothetical protein